MTPDFIKNAESELADIELKLAGITLLQQRGAQLRTLIAIGRQPYLSEQSEQQSVLGTAPINATLPASSSASPKTATQKQRVLDASANMIGTDGALSTRQLVDRLAVVGVEVGGADKIAALSAILSRSEKFKSDRAAGGWVLAMPHKEEPPLVAPTTEGA